MARHMAPEPALISQLHQYAVLSTARRALQDVLAVTSPSETDCRRLDQSLAELDPHAAFVRGLYGERCLGLWVFDTVRTHPSQLRQLAGDGGELGVLLSFLSTPLAAPLLKWDEVCYLRAMARQIDRAKQRDRLAANPVPAAGPEDLPQYARVSRLVLPAYFNATRRRDQAVAEVAVAQWGLALHVYRRQTGHYPPSLKAAANTLAWKLPHDPFTGTPLRYRRTSDGYLLYSLGVNGRDDGGEGRASGENGRPGTPAKGQDDIAWRVGA
jgi:hypothetical protein